MTTPAVEFFNVTKTFDDLVAVNDVSLSLPRGKTLGLIGPNGAGKTTLLRILVTLARPDCGDVRINGHSAIRDPLMVRQMLGFMPAEFGSPRNLNIGEYLDYFGCLHGVSSKERPKRIREVCELTDLTGREQVMVKGLSTGNRQRLLLAKTLLHDPDLLVLDEPASGLDPRARTELREIVRTLASMGKTIIISSHILPDIEDFSDRISIMEAGRLVIDGGLNELRETHASTTRVVRIRVPEADWNRAKKLLGEPAEIESVRERDHFIELSTNAENVNFTLGILLEHDIRVLQFAEDEPSLEEIFMRTTAGKVT